MFWTFKMSIDVYILWHFFGLATLLATIGQFFKSSGQPALVLAEQFEKTEKKILIKLFNLEI